MSKTKYFDLPEGVTPADIAAAADLPLVDRRAERAAALTELTGLSGPRESANYGDGLVPFTGNATQFFRKLIAAYPTRRTTEPYRTPDGVTTQVMTDTSNGRNTVVAMWQRAKGYAEGVYFLREKDMWNAKD